MDLDSLHRRTSLGDNAEWHVIAAAGPGGVIRRAAGRVAALVLAIASFNALVRLWQTGWNPAVLASAQAWVVPLATAVVLAPLVIVAARSEYRWRTQRERATRQAPPA